MSNEEARQNFAAFQAQGQCGELHESTQQPVHPLRFTRISGVGEATSQALQAELKDNGILQANDYVTPGLDSSIVAQITPQAFPTLFSLSGAQQRAVYAQLQICYADHNFYAHYNLRVLNFFDTLCSTPSAISDATTPGLSIYPNPTAGWVQLKGVPAGSPYKLYNAVGRLVQQNAVPASGRLLLASHLPGGLYLLQAGGHDQRVLLRR